MKNKNWWLYLIAFPAGHGAVDWGGGALWVLAPAMALAMHLSPGQVGMLFAMRQIGAGITHLPAGIAGDVLVWRGRFLLATFWWVALAQLAASTATNYWPIVLLLALASAGSGAWHPVAMGTMVQQMPNRRAFALGIHLVGGTVAEIAAPLLVGFLLLFMDWREVLQLNTIPAVIMGLCFFRLAPMVAPPPEGAFNRNQLQTLVKSLTSPTVLSILLIFLLQGMAVLAFMGMAPLYFQKAHGFSSDLTGLAISTFMISGAVLAPVIGRISDRIGRTWIIIVGLIGGGLGSWVLTIVSGTVPIFAILALTGLLMLTVRPVIMAMALEKIGRRESTVLGLISSIGEGVAAIGALLAGIVGNINLAYALILSAALSAMSAIIMSTLMRSLERPTLHGGLEHTPPAIPD